MLNGQNVFSNKNVFKTAFVQKADALYGKTEEDISPREAYATLGVLLSEQIDKKWNASKGRDKNEKEVYYFSMEFLLGKLLKANLMNLNALDVCVEGLAEMGIDFSVLQEQERDAGLGNGGLGRLAACFLDSLAFLNIPGHGLGIRYQYGLFEQKIVDGYQVEIPEYWLENGYIWEARRPEWAVEVRFGGKVIPGMVGGRLTFSHRDYESVLAVPYDVPITGFHNERVNTLRLFHAELNGEKEELHRLDVRDYYSVLEVKQSAEAISGFLYPDDSTESGKMLRIKQQYFLVCAGLQNIIRHFKRQYQDIRLFPRKVAVHINDTHPSLAIPELMRILIDEEHLSWDEAWQITTETIAYTNHTILGEALECWPVSLFEPLLPRIYMIVHEINERFCRKLWELYPGEWDTIARMAIIADGQVRMAHLAVVGSHSVNGVSKIHTKILKKQVMHRFYEVFREKFNNKTNGISHRRFLLAANPNLANLITEMLGTCWITHPKEMTGLLKYAQDAPFQTRIAEIKADNKQVLARFIYEKKGIAVDPGSIFDVQIKRFHAYKRQLLNLFQIMNLYNCLRENPTLDIVPRTFIFAGKAAPSYQLAKSIIKLLNTVADRINNDPFMRDKLRVIFLENYSVSLAERIIPAADVSEQISTAGKEASGTGNMKLMMNGAVLLGTLDGANVEILREVRDENLFIFGLRAEEVAEYQRTGNYRAREIYNRDARLSAVLDSLVDGTYPSGDFHDIYYSLLTNDEYFVLKDFESYVEAQERVDQVYQQRAKWLSMSIANIAHSGKFSSDRTVAEYATEIWDIRPTVPKSASVR